jgi:hypothetical protein
MIDYEVRLERCKREDTKDLVIQCIDKASIDNHKEQIDTFMFALELAGAVFLAAILISYAMTRIFE